MPAAVNPWYHLARSLSATYLSTYHGFRVHGTHHVPAEGGFILASNHCSFLDPPALAVSCPREVDFLARKTLFSSPAFGRTIRMLNAIPVDQERPDMTGLKIIIRRLKAGRAVVFFPEGSRSWDGELQPAQPGVGMVIEKAGVPVLPARFFGMHEAWPRGGNLHPFTPVSCCFGPMVIPESKQPDKRQRYQTLADQVMEAIQHIRKPDI